MSRCFIEVFSDIRLNESLAVYFNNAEVERVIINSESKELQIHVVFKNIVHIKFIQQVEKMIESKLCVNTDLSVKIISEYSVSYELDKLLLLYQDSILYELKQYSPVCFGILKKAEIIVVDGNIVITLKNNIIDYLKDKNVDQ